MKKVISFVLVVSMLFAMTAVFSGCGGAEKTKNDGKFTVYGYVTDPVKRDLYEHYQEKWAEKCEYPIEWIGGDIKMLMSSGDYPDIIAKNQFQNVDVARFASQGIFIPLDEYITEENTPNIWRMFQEQPTTKAIATSPDGHIYAIPSFGGNKGAYVETFWYINKVWLDKLGLDIPKTLPELKEVLRAFKNGDPNGNGKADEIPMTFYNEGAYSYPETLLSCWGVSTKFGLYDGYLNVQNGTVNFTPMMNEWKEMIKFYADLYKEGLLDIECFTYESNTFGSRLAAETPVVGVAFGKENPFGDNADQYVVILPISADGVIKPVVHIHPGSVGMRNMAHVTSACEDPAAAMRWLDTFYSKEATIENWYGDGSFNIEDGMYKWKDPIAEGFTSHSDMYYKLSIYGPHMLGYMNAEPKEDGGDINVLIEDCPALQSYRELYAMYEPYIDKETWPRPYYSPEDSSSISAFQTDIHNYVEQCKARWILGESDVEKDWNEYLNHLNKIGAQEYIEINQNAYDVYQKALADLK